jgi:hypothetical protein
MQYYDALIPQCVFCAALCIKDSEHANRCEIRKNMAVERHEGPGWRFRGTHEPWLSVERLPAATVVVDSTALLATLFRGGLVVASALLPVRIVVVAVVVTLQAVGSVALGTGRSVWVFHDGELRTSQVVVART